MTRKRFIKLVMAYRVYHNEASAMTTEVKRAGSYKRLFLWFLLRRLPDDFYTVPDTSASTGVMAFAGLVNEAVTSKRNPDFDPAAASLLLYYETAVSITERRQEFAETIEALDQKIRRITAVIVDAVVALTELLTSGHLTVNEARTMCAMPPLEAGSHVTAQTMYCEGETGSEYVGVDMGQNSGDITVRGSILSAAAASIAPCTIDIGTMSISEAVDSATERLVAENRRQMLGGLNYGA